MVNEPKEYLVEVDKISRDEWREALSKFDDANMFQTWEYGVEQWGRNNVSRVVLRKNGYILAATQVWVVRVPILGTGFAHISWGPMWRLHGRDLQLETVKNMVRALRNEYVIKRGLLFRIRSYEVDESLDGHKVREVLEKEGFSFQKKESRYHTYRIDLSLDLKELRQNFLPRWRRNLNKAEKLRLTVVSGDSEEMFQSFSRLYQDMLSRKRFREYIADMNKYARIQRELPENLKMRVFLCQFQGEVVAGETVPTIGNTAMYLMAASSTRSIDSKLNASYLLQWKIIEWAKENGFRYYDLRGGIEGDMLGVRFFKRGLSGDEIYYLGSFESCKNRGSLYTVRSAETLQNTYRKLKGFLGKREDNTKTGIERKEGALRT